MSPRQIQIKQFEIGQDLALQGLKEYLKAGGKTEDLMLDDPRLIKYYEIKGIKIEENDFKVSDEMKNFAESLKDPNLTTEQRKEKIKMFIRGGN